MLVISHDIHHYIIHYNVMPFIILTQYSDLFLFPVYIVPPQQHLTNSYLIDLLYQVVLLKQHQFPEVQFVVEGAILLGGPVFYNRL